MLWRRDVGGVFGGEAGPPSNGSAVLFVLRNSHGVRAVLVTGVKTDPPTVAAGTNKYSEPAARRASGRGREIRV